MPDATGITGLDVAIGLAFVYLILSLLCSAIQEAIAGIFDLRAQTLEKGLKNLLDDHGGVGGNGAPAHDVDRLSNELMSHGLIRTQYREAAWWDFKKSRGPSYISSKSFALALLDILDRRTPAPDADNPPLLVASIDAASVPAGTKNALRALAKDAGTDRERLRQRVEEWFDATMDRVSGWYKRKAQIVLCALAVVVTVGLNVNSIAIADRLVRDDAIRAAVVAAAAKTKLEPKAPLDPVTDELAKTAKLGIPIGWNKKKGDPVKADLSRERATRTLGGWLITIVMLSLGAPFWFGALSRVVSLRSAGAKPTPGKSEPAAAA